MTRKTGLHAQKLRYWLGAAGIVAMTGTVAPAHAFFYLHEGGQVQAGQASQAKSSGAQASSDDLAISSRIKEILEGLDSEDSILRQHQKQQEAGWSEVFEADIDKLLEHAPSHAMVTQVGPVQALEQESVGQKVPLRQALGMIVPGDFQVLLSERTPETRVSWYAAGDWVQALQHIALAHHLRIVVDWNRNVVGVGPWEETATWSFAPLEYDRAYHQHLIEKADRLREQADDQRRHRSLQDLEQMTFKVNVGRANVRKRPTTTDSEVVAVLSRGDSGRVHAKMQGIHCLDDWYLVEYEPGEKAWIHGNIATFR